MIQIRVKGNRLPYVTSELRRMIRQRDYLRGKANKTGSRILRQAYDQVKNAVSHTLYKLRKSYYTNKIEQHKDDLKNTWKVLKQAIGHTSKSTHIEKIDDGVEVITTNAEIAEACNMHFFSIGEKISWEISPIEMSHTAQIPVTNARFQFHGIAVNQVKVLIHKLVNGKSTGIHNIPNKALKDSVDFIAPALTTIFSLSMHSKVYPADLKIGKVTPVHKGGDKDDLNNYRPITVLPTIACVFEKIIYQQLYKYMTDNNLLGEKQYGFRSLHSTAIALSKTMNHWLINIDKGNKNSVVFLDIKKAFDTVNHRILLDKLECYGIKDQELKFFESYLSNRMQCCNVNGQTSSFRAISCGVPQGSTLGPLLFIIYLNDLPLAVKDAEITLYADDTSLYKAFKNIMDLNETLVPAFSDICDWLKCNKLSLNAIKSEFMIIGTAQKIKYQILNQKLPHL